MTKKNEDAVIISSAAQAKELYGWNIDEKLWANKPVLMIPIAPVAPGPSQDRALACNECSVSEDLRGGDKCKGCRSEITQLRATVERLKKYRTKAICHSKELHGNIQDLEKHIAGLGDAAADQAEQMADKDALITKYESHIARHAVGLGVLDAK